MKTFSVAFVAFAAGVLLTMALTSRGDRLPAAPPKAPPPPPAPAPLIEENRRLSDEVRRLNDELAELKKAAPAPKPVEPPAPAPKVPVNLREKFGAFAQKGLGAFQDPGFGEFTTEIKNSGPEGLAFLREALLTSKTAGERFLAAALLTLQKDPASIAALAEALEKEQDFFVRRQVSQGLAYIGTEAAEEPLRKAMTSDADWGVRVNSAYGLAKLGREDGRRRLEEAYGSPDTPAEYRVPILNGLVDVASPASAPIFRKILTDTQDLTYLLLAVTALGKMKDAESLPALQALSTSSSTAETVRDAAKMAIEEIRK